MFAETDYNSLYLLFDYVGKKFNDWAPIDTNWGLDIYEPLNFPVGGLYATDHDQAGTEYFFYDGVLTYSMYAWVLLGGVCSGIKITKGKYIRNDRSNFFLEKEPEEYSRELSVCSRLFSSVLDLSPKDFNTEDDFIKEAVRLFEGAAVFSEKTEYEYYFTLNEDIFPQKLVDKCMISICADEEGIEEIFLSITDKAQKKALSSWSGKCLPPRSQTKSEQKNQGIFGFIKRLLK